MKKKKLLSSISLWMASFLFVSSWIVFGVAMAIKTANVGLNGQVTFTATGVYAKVSGSVTGTATTNTLNDITIDASTTNASQSWDDVKFDFKNESTPIVTTITVENLSEERSIWVIFNETISVTNITLERTSDGSSVDAFSAIEIPAKTGSTTSSKTFTITMNISDKNKNVSGSFNLNMELTTEEPALDESAYLYFTFEYSSSAKTAMVYSFDNSKHYGVNRDNLVIPSKVSKDGIKYTVTTIDYIYDTGNNSHVESIYIPATITRITTCYFEKLTSAIFEAPEGWEYEWNEDVQSYVQVDSKELSDPETAGTVLKNLSSTKQLVKR